jgi:uncharacterized protein YecT (DUF1311 family)
MVNLSNLPWKEIFLVIATSLTTAVVGGVAYLIRRRIEGSSGASQLERRSKVLALHKELKTEGMTISDLDRLEDELSRRRKVAHRIEDQVAAELAQQRNWQPAPGQSQAEMNILGGADLEISRAMLARAVLELEMHHGSSGVELLRAAQEAWEVYANAEAKFGASMFEGGTAYPTIFLSELERLTVSRVAQIRSHTDYLRKL